MAYYNPPRTRNLYDPKLQHPFSVSRSKVENFIKCPRCFYLDRRLGIDQPSGPSFTLNDAVDTLMKKEFDLLRRAKKPYALAQKYAIEAIPFTHPDLPTWRDDHKKYIGVSHHHQPTNLTITGIIDDIWQDKQGKLHIVDYKATSTQREISLEDQWKQGYKKQVEFYQWIFRQKGFDISGVAYFVFANGKKGNPRFDAKLEFEIEIISYRGDDSWVEPAIFDIKKCLDGDKIPPPSAKCDFCKYRSVAAEREQEGRAHKETGPPKSQKFDHGKLF